MQLLDKFDEGFRFLYVLLIYIANVHGLSL